MILYLERKLNESKCVNESDLGISCIGDFFSFFLSLYKISPFKREMNEKSRLHEINDRSRTVESSRD